MVFSFSDENQEGVMDNLLEALKTGSAFNVGREKRDGKRRTPRAAGGNLLSQFEPCCKKICLHGVWCLSMFYTN